MNNKYTLIELLSEYEVCIPIIQRDYAHGRLNEKSNEIRKHIISEILTCLSENDEEKDFNFIYGTEENKKFFPVDGQQRLTTLYIIHWYLAVRSSDMDILEDFKRLKSFSYETRNAANEFFVMLKKSPEELIKIVAKDTENLKQEIENEAWFQSEWSNDPTVNSVLVFLNDLGKGKLKPDVCKKYYEKLRDNKSIYFTLIIEEQENAENITAQSYIRMNARGKSLEPFENVKAMLSGIDEKLENKTEIIRKYDEEYIDVFFNKAVSSLKDEDKNNLKEKTEYLNKKSMNFIHNMYIINKNENISESSFVSLMYEISRGKVDGEFFEIYFNNIIEVLDYYKNNQKDEHVEKLLEDDLKNDCLCEIYATSFYIYYYYINHNSVISPKKLELFLYVLKNLNYTNWQSSHENIKQFSEKVAQNDDVFFYFKEKSIDDIIKDFGNNVGLNDIRVRITEQKIKVNIIKNNNLDNYYFKELEEQTSCRKIQYLLYISGYWENQGQEKFEKFNNEYMKYAKSWFCQNEAEIDWCIYYAIAVNMDNDKLKTAIDINQNCEKNKHIWKDEFYFWNDADEVAGSVVDSVKQHMIGIKKAYKYKKEIQQYINNLPNDNNYNDCWLKYAVKYAKKYNEKSLINSKLAYENGIVMVKETKSFYHDGSSKFVYKCDYENGILMMKEIEGLRYDVFILSQIEKLYLRLKDLSKTAESSYTFDKQRHFKNSSGTIEYSTGERSFIMKLNIDVNIKNINDKFKSQLCCYEYCEEEGEYKIYQVDGIYKFKVYKYDIKDIINKRNIECENKKNYLEQFKLDDYLEIKESNLHKDWEKITRSIWRSKETVLLYFNGVPEEDTYEL